MFRKFLFPVMLAFVLIIVTACSPAKPVNLTSADKGSQVNVQVGDQIVISLDGNPSTGYTWETQGLDSTIIQQVGEATFVSSNTGLVGSGGTLTLTFKALKAGTVPLNLVYHRPWETGVAPVDTFAVTVTVK
jgi:inhibitor of cysteine peptidase